ncbi:arylsulfatase [Altericroceibacterium endophyticum]|uniref:Sulfatase-like hydrolase/transferase n=1 Tax=Altericroceibacterium endophyticum TaxID=1808508 RepID=A0A6I4T8I4_9SPHN|nr:arylsulfatase [Altericroceibacterium endophyticum]MXO66431.1 sulfatase-like hydrolase/transferase [Altericroceibacterium endophyticum]
MTTRRKSSIPRLAGVAFALLLLTHSPSPAIAQEGDDTQWKAYPRAAEAPEGAPNVLLIMTDDVGFSASSTFGGAVPTPAFDELARQGLRYNAFHTTAMCSPTRAALLTGRNHHAVGSGSIADVSLDEPGYTSVIPKSAATIAQVLKKNGYDTSFFGKNHNTPVWENTPVGPFDNWPNGMGFDYFYGFNAPFADQFNPALIENRNTVRPPDEADYILDRDLADHLIHWLNVQKELRPDHPFFAYFASGSTHAPHHAPADWIARFKGKFDMGWDRLREDTFERQKKMGIIPPDAVLTPRPEGLPAWDSISPELQAAYARTMEVAAAQLAYFDSQIGRVLDTLSQSGQLENTLVIYIQGDNGASEEDLNGSADLVRVISGSPMTNADLIAAKDDYGGPSTFGTYPAAWAWATNTPFQWGKRVASHFGGLRDGMVVSWPAGIKDKGEVRDQFTHVIDVAPTIYDAAGITPPEKVDGVVQQPIDGISFTYSFDNASAPERHKEQYFEMLGNRAYYKDGWIASTIPGRMPWDYAARTAPEDFKWALYDLKNDWSQSRDVSANYPEKLAKLQADFDAAAKKYHVYPLNADLNANMAAQLRPSRLGSRTSFTYYPGDTRYNNYSFPSVSAGWEIIANVGISGDASNGPVLVQGDHFGGQAMIIDRGKPTYIVNPGSAGSPVTVQPDAPLPAGQYEVSVAFLPLQQGGTRLEMRVDDKLVASRETALTIHGRGDAYIGRRSIAPFFSDPLAERIAERCSCSIQSVTLQKMKP